MKQKYPCMTFYVFFVHCTSLNIIFLYIRTCARGREYKCAISLTQQCIATRCFIPWMNQVWTYSIEWARDSAVHSEGLTCFVSIESAGLKELIWMIQTFIKTGTAATYWRFYCIFIYPKNQLRCQHKKTHSENIFNYQYWPNFFYFRPQKKKKKRINNSSFNKANISLNRNI